MAEQRPIHPVLGSGIRFLLRTWSRYPKAPGYLTRIVEHIGHRLAAKPLDCTIFNGMKMRCDLKDHIQRQIYFRGAYEPIESYLVTRLLREGMVFVDAGANVGQYSLLAAGAVGYAGEVHAFEPVPKNFELLAGNVSRNGLGRIVRLNRNALWNRNEEVTLSLGPEGEGNDGVYTVAPRPDPAVTISANTIVLDDYVLHNKVRRVDFIKMDVEGAELHVLQGASRVIDMWRPTMLIEINRLTCARLGYDPERVWDFLKPFGYNMWTIGQSAEESHQLQSLIGIGLANVIFHTGSLPDEVMAGWTIKSALRFHRHTNHAEF